MTASASRSLGVPAYTGVGTRPYVAWDDAA
jgi:hypothetical protein